MKKLHWFWCWLCYRAYLALPLPMTHRSLYGRFSLWLLGFAGFYAYDPCHSPREQAPAVIATSGKDAT